MLSDAEKNVFYALIVTTLVGLTGMKTEFSLRKPSITSLSVKSINMKYNRRYEPYRINGFRI